MSKLKKEFINKWKSWWILQKQGLELTEAFEIELNAIISQELNEWISVKTRCPENDDLVEVWFTKGTSLPDYYKGYQEFAFYINGRWEKRDSECGSDMENNPDLKFISHWKKSSLPPTIN